jgi:TRAP-type mannitol/chloroaromatic compound transport system permease small subunit
MHPIFWVLIFLPPFVTWVVWLRARSGAKGSRAITPQTGWLPRYGFWMLLAIVYGVMITAALVRRQI